jgi:hypothetical protein
MAASNPLIGALEPRGRLPDGVTDDVVVQAGGSQVSSPAVALSHEVELPQHRLRAGDLDVVHELVGEIAEAHTKQFSEPLQDHFAKALEAVGNTMTSKKGEFGWDSILDAYEKVEWLPVMGTVRMPRIIVGPDIEAVLTEQGGPNAAQKQRLQGIFERKQAEYVSRRRSRRIR